MAVPACLRLADDVFPRVRARAARDLVAQGWSQARAARHLGVTQAMVSKYLAGAPGSDGPLVERLAEEVVRSADAPAPDGPSGWCAVLSAGEGRKGADEAMEDLLAAEALLRRGRPLLLVPQIGMNVARALSTARSAQDVLAFPGRIVEAGGRLLSPAPPAFGGSGHLARCLLALREEEGAVLALASVRGGSDVRRLLPKGSALIQRRPGDRDPEAGFRRAVARAPGTHLLHDPGGHGIEPCLYVAGADARAVAARVLALHERLVNP